MTKKAKPVESRCTEDSKRTSIKKLAVGIGAVGLSAPKEWSKPVVNSVILPAHAATSGTDGDGGDGTMTTEPPLPSETTEPPLPTDFFGDLDELIMANTLDSNVLKNDSLIAQTGKSVINMVAGKAHAGSNGTVICIKTNSNQFDVDFQEFGIHWTLSGNIGDPLANMVNECADKTFSGVLMSVDSVDPDGVNITVSANRVESLKKKIDPGPCNFEFGCEDISVGL